MEKVLLHCCCAPCSSAIIEWMMNNDVTPVLYYNNPNIYPYEEYIIRKNELTRYVTSLGLRVIDDDSRPDWQGWEHYHQCWKDAVSGLEHEPERGRRCLECFKLRLLAAAKIAVEEGIETFTTTLASSRWKNLDQINKAGEWAAEQVNNRLASEHEDDTLASEHCANTLASEQGNDHLFQLHFDGRNWRKGGLQQRRNELLKQNGFYNQQYCGCEFSFRKNEP